MNTEHTANNAHDERYIYSEKDIFIWIGKNIT